MRLINGNSLFLPEFPRFFDNFKTRNWHNGNSGNHTSSTNTTIPAVNILENNDGYIVEMAVPGMSKKDFNIQLEDNLLTIASEHKDGTPMNEDDRWLHREFSYQSFHRSFRLNHKVVDDMKIKATYENGLLRLSIPKKEEAKINPPKRISIS
jgi:HSP20 family protein